MSIKAPEFLVYIKDKTSPEFEYKSNAVSIVRNGALYAVTYANGKSYNYTSESIKLYPLISTVDNVRIYINQVRHSSYDKVDDYGKYIVCRGERYRSLPMVRNSSVEIYPLNFDIRPTQSIIDYFKDIVQNSLPSAVDANYAEQTSANANEATSKIVKQTLENIDLQDSRSALFNYVNKSIVAPSQLPPNILYPFGCNESQKKAVEAAITNQFSIIEGPPGTGKTQTILNIIANLVAQNKTVAVVSNNNSAVFNVQEKLEKEKYGFLFASLGSSNNKKAFFNSLEPKTFDASFYMSEDDMQQAKTEMAFLQEKLNSCFDNRNKLAKLKVDLTDAEIEFEHLKKNQPFSAELMQEYDTAFRCQWSTAKVLELRKLISKTRFSILLIIRLIVQYLFFDIKNITKRIDKLGVYANHKFYELRIAELKAQICETSNWLEKNDAKGTLERHTNLSTQIFNGTLFNRFAHLNHIEFSQINYKSNFGEFIKRYPVITSSTVSLCSSAPRDFLFDYLIIDESSQADIVKSSLCLSKCRNAVIVGDSMQLSHIVDAQSIQINEQLMNKHDIDQPYNYVDESILDSLKLIFKNNIPCTLLREHYRCHPQIIGFCNKKYYNNELIVMTEGSDHPFKIIETNITGAQMNTNQRQVDETVRYIQDNFVENLPHVGVVSPYRDHANLLKRQLPKAVLADTIHKFQGGEKDAIIFNTVRGKITRFLDNPNLINVAVSRAKNQFVIVKPASMELSHGTNIGDLIRYICYINEPQKVITKGAICSVFDLLYKEYNDAFIEFIDENKNIKGSAAEVIIHKLLIEILSDTQYLSVDFVREYRLSDLVRDYSYLDKDEISFVKTSSRLDFLLYNKIDKAPILAIEVDGRTFHNDNKQQERDSKKNRVLEVLNLPLLRLSTDGHSEQERIIESLNLAMANSCVVNAQ